MLDGGYDGGDGFGLVRVDIHNRFVGAAGDGGNQNAFDDLVRRFRQQYAVFERTRFVFVGITDDVFVAVFALCGNGRLPFAPGRETCAAHAAEVGVLQLGNDALRIGKRRQQAFAAADFAPRGQIRADLAGRVQ